MYNETCPVVHIHFNYFQNLSIDKSAEILLDPIKRSKWDKNSTNTQILEKLSETEFIQSYVYKFPVRNREFVDKVTIQRSSDELRIVSYSVNYAVIYIQNYQYDAKNIPGRNLFTYIHLKQRQFHIEIEFIFQVDLTITHKEKTEKIYAASAKQWSEKFLENLNGLYC